MCSVNLLSDSRLEHGCWGSKPMRECLPVSTMKRVC
jgi:hypothetical protein